MCGITGFVLTHKSPNVEAEKILQLMTVQLFSRGPDKEGVWLDKNAGVGLGHRRLAIQDLSPAGDQPMHSKNNRYTIVFNGEIYNFLVLRDELVKLGYSFSGHSDTEVILAAINEWGLKKSLIKFVGMFAFALWDRERNSLCLVRDRIGEKPLYYGVINNNFVFGSELKAIRAYPGSEACIDRHALSLYMRYCYIPTPHTIYKNIKKLPPGTILEILVQKNSLKMSSPVHYWKLSDEWGGKGAVCANDATKELDSLLRKVVSDQMVSDVPVGSFLSGGIDSSCITSIMQAVSDKPVHTFSIGFDESNYDEARYAKKIADHLGTHHTEYYFTSLDAQNIIPDIATIYDEPFADSSQIPMCLLSKITRNDVTVALSGDGGDEVFCGYNRYLWGRGIWNNIKNIPLPFRKGVSKLTQAIPPGYYDSVFSIYNKFLPDARCYKNVGDKLHKLAGILDVNTPDEMYQRLVSTWKHPENIVLTRSQSELAVTRVEHPNIKNISELMMYLDMVTYLPDDILVKVDRAAMAASLETRIPFLDKRIIDFSLALPLDLKLKDGKGKWIIREVLGNYIPKNLIERPKMGFALPLDAWLRKGLKSWACDLLDENTIKSQGYFDYRVVDKHLKEHMSGRRNCSYQLWNILMFQSWYNHWV